MASTHFPGVSADAANSNSVKITTSGKAGFSGIQASTKLVPAFVMLSWFRSVTAVALTFQVISNKSGRIRKCV